MSLYTKARKHIDMNRVKELREEAVKEQKIAEVKKQQEEILAELKRIEIKENLKYSNWRRDLENLNETMTTAGMGMVNYPPQGDVDLDNAVSPFTLSGSSEHGYNSVTKSVRGDRSKYDTIVVRVTSSSSDWEIVRGDALVTLGSGGSGIKTIVIPRTYASIYYTAKDDGNVTFHTVYQRRAPVNVFVPLDDPEANSFIRGGLGGSEERRQQLKDQLEAGNELMIKLGLDPSKTSPGDIEIAADYPADDYNAQDEVTLKFLQSGALGGGPRIEKAINDLLKARSKSGYGRR